MTMMIMRMVIVMCFFILKDLKQGWHQVADKTMMLMMITLVRMMMMMMTIKMMMMMMIVLFFPQQTVFFVGFQHVKFQYSDKRWFQVSVSLFQGTGKVGLLTLKLVVNLLLHVNNLNIREGKPIYKYIRYTVVSLQTNLKGGGSYSLYGILYCQGN